MRYGAVSIAIYGKISAKEAAEEYPEAVGEEVVMNSFAYFSHSDTVDTGSGYGSRYYIGCHSY